MTDSNIITPDSRDLTISALRESLESAHQFGAINHERAERANARIAELEEVLNWIELKTRECELEPLDRLREIVTKVDHIRPRIEREIVA